MNPNVFADAALLPLPNHYPGKVRDVFDLQDGRLVFVTTDRLSAFDRNITLVPYKGEILNRITRFWFEKTADILGNHVLSYPDPNVMIGKKLKMLPIEVVVRRYMTGSTGTSIWMKYQNGEREMYGHTFPDGMVKNQKLPENIVTPTTKGKDDIPVSGKEIVDRKMVEPELWKEVEDKALKLFARGQEIAAKLGLILVDTKYEFGLDKNGKLCLADEIHTPDSSRYWIAKTYEERFRAGQDPDSLDKEFARLWLAARMKDTKNDPLPEITPADNENFSRKYIELYERVTGETFVPTDPEMPVLERIRKNLAPLMAELKAAST